MKRIITFCILVCAFVAFNQAQTPQAGPVQQTTQTDTTQVKKITEWVDTPADKSPTANNDYDYYGWDLSRFNLGNNIAWVSIVTLIIVFAFPIFIVFIAFYFKYKNKQAKYKLAEQALAAGQPIPEEFLKNNLDKDMQAKGIKNIFVGIGLFLFLWGLVSFPIGCIGILIFFIGVGEVVIANTSKKNEEKKTNGNNDR